MTDTAGIFRYLVAAAFGSAGALFFSIATVRLATQHAWGPAAVAALLAVGSGAVSWYGGLGIHVRWRFGIDLEHAERLAVYLRMIRRNGSISYDGPGKRGNDFRRSTFYRAIGS